ncbi:MAG: fibronectin type III domain-containing protein [Flavobacteriales bacterium]|nr:fibronectin type III domain-containing protein [Flavobacteriales bacterium]
MRIRCDWNNSSPSACGVQARAETEDYTFTVSAPPACVAPTALSVGSITTTSASVSFTGTSLSYNYEVRTSGAAGSGPTGLATSGTGAASPIALGGLTAATTYTVYVQGVCAGPTTSAWSTGAVFTTLCNAFPIPYSQDFSTAVAPALPSCLSAVDVNGPSAPPVSGARAALR